MYTNIADIWNNVNEICYILVTPQLFDCSKDLQNFLHGYARMTFFLALAVYLNVVNIDKSPAFICVRPVFIRFYPCKKRFFICYSSKTDGLRTNRALQTI